MQGNSPFLSDCYRWMSKLKSIYWVAVQTVMPLSEEKNQRETIGNKYCEAGKYSSQVPTLLYKLGLGM